VIDRQHLLLSAQRALLGCIGPSIQAVAVKATASENGNELMLIVFADMAATDDELEDFDAEAGTQLMADFPSVTHYDFRVVRGDPTRVPAEVGLWAFCRRDVRLVHPRE
jgi:hypothetical protein